MSILTQGKHCNELHHICVAPLLTYSTKGSMIRQAMTTPEKPINFNDLFNNQQPDEEIEVSVPIASGRILIRKEAGLAEPEVEYTPTQGESIVFATLSTHGTEKRVFDGQDIPQRNIAPVDGSQMNLTFASQRDVPRSLELGAADGKLRPIERPEIRIRKRII